MSNYKYQDGPLPVLVSARVRLTRDQREQVKEAYYALKNAVCQPVAVSNHTGLQVETQMSSQDLDKKLGMSSLVFSDICASRDSLSLGIVLKIQKVLGVDILSKEDLLASCQSYIDYNFEKLD